jgi:hypothetical protein
MLAFSVNAFAVTPENTGESIYPPSGPSGLTEGQIEMQTVKSYPEYRKYQTTLGKTNTLLTSSDPERYILFTTNGNTIKFSGKFTNDTITKVFLGNLWNVTNESEGLENKGDGSFEGFITANVAGDVPFGNIFVSTDKNTESFKIDHDNNGFFFTDNGLGKKNEQITENFRTATAETNLYYVTGKPAGELTDEDKTAAKKVLAEIKAKAEELTEGLTDDRDKARILSDWTADNVFYDTKTAEGIVTAKTISLVNVWQTRHTVCGGYANMYAALLEAAGIKAVNIYGGVVSPGKCSYMELPEKTVVHEWTAFWYEKEKRWVITDPGWDSGNRFQNGTTEVPKSILKTFFDATPLSLSLTHRAERAEYRDYFSVIPALNESTSSAQNFSALQAGNETSPPELTEDGQEVTEEVTGDNAVTGETAPQTTENITETTPAVKPPKPALTIETVNDNFPDWPLYVAIAAMIAGIVILTVIIARKKK